MANVAHAPFPQIARLSITPDEVVPEVSRIAAMPLGIGLGLQHSDHRGCHWMDQQPLVADPCAGSTWGVPDPAYPDDTIPANRTLLLDVITDIDTSRFEDIYGLGGATRSRSRKADACPTRNRLFTVDPRRRLLPAGGQWLPLSPAELLAEKLHMHIDLLKRLNPGKRFDESGRTIEVTNVDRAEAPKAARIEVNKAIGGVLAFDSEDTLIAFYPATIGSEETRSPSGKLEITHIARTQPTPTIRPS